MITSLSDWLKVLAPIFQPIRSDTKTNRGSRVYIFPRFASSTCNYFVLSGLLNCLRPFRLAKVITLVLVLRHLIETRFNSNQIKRWLLWRGRNQSSGRKISPSGVENQQTQVKYDAESGNQPLASMVGNECSHHCASPVPHSVLILIGILHTVCLLILEEYFLSCDRFLLVT